MCSDICVLMVKAVMNQKEVKEKLKQTREAINAKQYHDAVKLCQVAACIFHLQKTR